MEVFTLNFLRTAEYLYKKILISTLIWKEKGSQKNIKTKIIKLTKEHIQNPCDI